MSYTALYRKFRPSGFEEVKGQDHIVTTLKNQIKSNRIGHAYIFTGTRGTGKTSVAKIFAKMYIIYCYLQITIFTTKLCNFYNFFHIRCGFTGFPFCDCLPRYAELFGNTFLCHFLHLSKLDQIVLKHSSPP